MAKVNLEHVKEQMYRVPPGSYEGWEGGSFPCIRVKRNRDSLPRWVVIMRINLNQHLKKLSKEKWELQLSKLSQFSFTN